MSVLTRPPIVTSGLVLHLDAANRKSYPGSGTTWFDMSGNGNSGIFTGTLPYSPEFGGSIRFGTGTVSVPFVLNTSTDYTVEVVAKCNNMTIPDPPANRQTVWAFVGNTSFGYQHLDLEVWNGLIVSFNGDGTSYTNAGNYSIDANTLITYTLRKSGSTQSWYTNSRYLGATTQTFNSTSTYFKLGTRYLGTGYSSQDWNGSIYSAKIYNRALSAQEILQNYNAQKARFGLP